MEPKQEWLQQNFDLDDAALSKMIKQCSPLLDCSVDANLKLRLNFYMNALGDKQEAVALIINCLSMFSYSLENRLKP